MQLPLKRESWWRRWLRAFWACFHPPKVQPRFQARTLEEFNRRHLEQIRLAAEYSPELRVEIITTADPCPLCREAARHLYKVGDLPELPLHKGCTCRYRPVAVRE